MKIAFVIPRLCDGGAERVVANLANGLSEHGYDIAVVNFFKSKNEYVTSKKVERIYLFENKDNYNSQSKIMVIKKIRKILKEKDYVIPFLPSPQVLCMFATIGLKCKRIDTIRENPNKEKFSGNINNRLWRLTFITSHKIIFQNEEQKNFFSKLEQKKGIIVPNPVQEKFINRDKVINDKITHFVAAGRLTEQKNYPLMIKAFANAVNQNCNLTLEIFGAGEQKYKNYLNNIIKALNVQNNIFIKERTNKLEEEYSKNEAYILSSNYEGSPNALIEAMASGLICISTNCKTGPSEIIDDGVNGFLTNVCDEDMLTKKILDVSNLNIDEANKISKLAVEKVLSNFTIKKSLEKLYLE